MHERNRKRAAQIAGKTPDIRTMIQEGQPKARMTQDEYDVKCFNAMVACNWSFKQFSVGSFRELLDMGHGFEVPTPKIMKARLKKYTKLAQKEIQERLESNDSRISLALDCWSSSNRLEFMGIFSLWPVIRIGDRSFPEPIICSAQKHIIHNV